MVEGNQLGNEGTPPHHLLSQRSLVVLLFIKLRMTGVQIRMSNNINSPAYGSGTDLKKKKPVALKKMPDSTLHDWTSKNPSSVVSLKQQRHIRSAAMMTEK